jgi:hypothetical protein
MEKLVMDALKHVNKVSYELAHEESLSKETREELLELWRKTSFAESYGDY